MTRPRPVSTDTVARSYVQLTVAVVALEHRLELLEKRIERVLDQVTRLGACLPPDTQILAEQLAAIEAFKAAARKAGVL